MLVCIKASTKSAWAIFQDFAIHILEVLPVHITSLLVCIKFPYKLYKTLEDIFTNRLSVYYQFIMHLGYLTRHQARENAQDKAIKEKKKLKKLEAKYSF